MRCLSPSARYSIQVFEGKEQVVVDARGFASTHALEKPVIANFEVQGLLDHEIEEALSAFSFSGLPEGVSPLTKISVFDTEAFCQQYDDDRRDEMQIQIDNRMIKLQEQFGGFIIVDMPAAARPWERYDEQSAEDIIKLVGLLGYKATAQAVRLYEYENQNRQEIIDAMERIENPDLYADEDSEPEAVGTADAPKEAFAVES